MTASLYHNGSSASGAGIGFSSSFKRAPLQVVIEIMLAVHAPAQAEDVRRCHLRVKLDVVACAIPEKARTTQQIMHLIGAPARQAEALERHLDPAALAGVRIEIDYVQHDVSAV